MRARLTISELAAHAGRGPGTDAERRAAAWLAGELRRGGHEVKVESFWCRPNWALAHAWHVALALAGSLLTVAEPWAGFALLAVALAAVLADGLLGISPGRRLTPERASQNVVARTVGEPHPGMHTRLLIVANYDAGRTGLIYSAPLSALRHGLARVTGGRAPGWLGWLVLLTAWLAAVTLIRATDGTSNLLRVLQFVPTAGLVLVLALLLEAARAPFGPAASDNASGTAVALALFAALAASPPARLRPELVLAGAHEGGGIGLRRNLRAHRHERTRGNIIVLGLGPSAVGTPRWWTSDGALIPLPTARVLRRLCARLAARPYRGRGTSAAFAARLWRLPTVTLGALDDHGRVPRSHQPADLPDVVDEAAAGRVLELALELVDALDADLGRRDERAQQAASAIPA